MTETKTSKDSWNGLLTNYLKADNLESQTDVFACVDVKVKDKDMELELERKEEKFVFSMNVTNKLFLKNNGINAPKEVIGKKLTLEKVKAFNPTLKKEVDSLRIVRLD